MEKEGGGGALHPRWRMQSPSPALYPPHEHYQDERRAHGSRWHPVTLIQDGGDCVYHFERAAILEWVHGCVQKGHAITNPVNRDPIDFKQLVVNDKLQAIIDRRLRELQGSEAGDACARRPQPGEVQEERKGDE